MAFWPNYHLLSRAEGGFYTWLRLGRVVEIFFEIDNGKLWSCVNTTPQ
jgi:hypothetical protein